MKYPIAMTVLQYLIFPNFTREFLKLFRARVVGQGKEISSAKSVRQKVLGVPHNSEAVCGINSAKQTGKKEGDGGGNSAFPLRNQIEDSPAICLNTWKAGHHRKILFSLREEKIGCAPCLPAGRQNEKSKEYFSVVWRVERAVAGLAKSGLPEFSFLIFKEEL